MRDIALSIAFGRGRSAERQGAMAKRPSKAKQTPATEPKAKGKSRSTRESTLGAARAAAVDRETAPNSVLAGRIARLMGLVGGMVVLKERRDRGPDWKREVNALAAALWRQSDDMLRDVETAIDLDRAPKSIVPRLHELAEVLRTLHRAIGRPEACWILLDDVGGVCAGALRSVFEALTRLESLMPRDYRLPAPSIDPEAARRLAGEWRRFGEAATVGAERAEWIDAGDRTQAPFIGGADPTRALAASEGESIDGPRWAMALFAHGSKTERLAALASLRALADESCKVAGVAVRPGTHPDRALTAWTAHLFAAAPVEWGGFGGRYGTTLIHGRADAPARFATILDVARASADELDRLAGPSSGPYGAVRQRRGQQNPYSVRLSAAPAAAMAAQVEALRARVGSGKPGDEADVLAAVAGGLLQDAFDAGFDAGTVRRREAEVYHDEAAADGANPGRWNLFIRWVALAIRDKAAGFPKATEDGEPWLREGLPVFARMLRAQAAAPVRSEADGEDAPLKADAESRALGVLAAHPDWTDEAIAQGADVARTSLYRWPRFKAARKAARNAGRAGMTRGFQREDGSVEAIDDDD